MLEIRRLHPDAALPTLSYGDSAAYDLSAYLTTPGGRPLTATIGPSSSKIIPTGLAFRPPPGHLVLICSRSGLASRSVFVSNAPGVVDPNYIGEIKVILFNGGLEVFYVKHGDRIAQALVTPFLACPLKEVESFPETTRGDRGFGSTGA